MAFNLQRGKVILKKLLQPRFFFTATDNIKVSTALELMEKAFKSANVSEPELSSKYLVSQLLGNGNPNEYYGFLNHTLKAIEIEELNRLLNCRLAHMPLQYIAGTWDFRSISIKVRPPVFIPRIETEQLVDVVLERLPTNRPVSVLEVGPGSGNICLSLLSECDALTVSAIERSRSSVELTLENARDLGLISRLTVAEGKVEEAGFQDQQFDAIVSNPPYVLRKDLMKLPPDISLYEDLRALDGGADGLDVILPIVELADRVLPADGKIFLEVDPCHPHILPSRLKSLHSRFLISEIIKDYRGVERFLVLNRT